MLKAILARLQQGHRTAAYPAAAPPLPDRFRGLPVLEPGKCPAGCRDCAEACPTGAVTAGEGGLRLDLGACLFCTGCVEACPEGALRYSQDHRLAARRREDLVLEAAGPAPAGGHPAAAAAGGALQAGRGLQLARALDEKMRRLFGRSLKLRQVSAGGCNGCEVEVNVLNTVVFDLGRFGIQFVASPRHADGLLITGPVTANMAAALRKTHDAVPPPRIVIAVGACAISGGPYAGHPEVMNGAAGLLPVDLYVPGCPPHPFTILDGLLRLLGRLE